MSKFIRTLFIALSLAAPLGAQTQQASVSGIVKDATGAVIANALVVATNAATGIRTTSQANESGFYSMPFLPPGTYNVTVEQSGFKRFLREGLLLTTGQKLALDIELEVGAANETVTVTGETPLLNTRSAELGQLVEAKSVENLPLDNRRTLNVIKILGGAVFAAYDPTTSPAFSLNGSRARSQAFMMDGGMGDNARIAIGHIGFDPPVEAIAEVKVLANNWSAEYGGSAGGIIIANTKSGTNKFHGSLYEYFRNDVLDAANFFAPLKPGTNEKLKAPLRYNIFGGAIGGPVRRDRTFFFFNYEGTRRRDGQVRVLTVPPARQRAGDFSQTFDAQGRLIPIYDPATTRPNPGYDPTKPVSAANLQFLRDQFAGNIIPASKLDPVAVKLMQFYPLPNQAPSNATGANNFSANYVVQLTADTYVARGDHSFSDKDKVTGRFIAQNRPITNTSVFPNPAAETLTDQILTQRIWYGEWTRVFAPTLVNQFRFAYRVNRFRGFGKSLGDDFTGQLGLQGLQNVETKGFPVFGAAGFTQLGAGLIQNTLAPVRIMQFVENLSWTRGSHVLKFGGEIRRSYMFNQTRNIPNFSFGVQPTALPGVAGGGNGLASLLSGFPTSFSLGESQPLNRYNFYGNAFVQDDWTISSNLTLNLGLRWEVDTPLSDEKNRINSFDPTAINPVSNTPGVVKFLGANGFRDNAYNMDWNNFGPRIGFAWSPGFLKNTVIRGGAGIFFAHPFDGNAQGSAALGFGLNANLNSPDNGITAPFLLRNGVPGFTLTAPQLNDSFGAVQVGRPTNTSVGFYEQNRRTGYSQQMNLSVQRELPGQMVFEIGYAGNISRKLSSSDVSLNQIAPSVLGPGRASQQFRPFPQFTNVSIIFPTFGNSEYHGMVLKLEKRFSRGLSLLGTYTWSHFMNDVNDAGSGGATLGDGDTSAYSNYYNRGADWGPSDNDIRHRMTITSVYELPFGKGRAHLSDHPLRYIAGGWGVGMVATLQSGPPFTVTTQNNTTNAFSAGALRADVPRNPNLPADQRTLSRWFDTTAFAQPAQFTFGNQGPGILRGDGQVNFDFSILRDFKFGEGKKFQFRVETFNAFNHPNFRLPGRVLGAPGFGVVNSAFPGRQIQLGARIVF